PRRRLEHPGGELDDVRGDSGFDKPVIAARESSMKRWIVVLAGVCVAGFAAAQQPSAGAAQAAAPQAAHAPAHDPPLEIYEIDLDPSGQAFSFGKPKLDGDAYVFVAWPERQTVRLSRAKVKKIT